MSNFIRKGMLTRSPIIAGLVFGSAVIVSTAFAGEMPYRSEED